MIKRTWERFKFFRFLVVGVINTAVGYALFSFFIFLGIHYSLAALLGTILGIMFNFKSTGKLVFRNKDNSRFFKFCGVYGVTYLVNIAALKVFKSANFSMYAAGAVLTLPLAFLSFMLNRKFVFPRSEK